MARAFVFGDDIDTDQLAPARYLRVPPEEMARHCLERIDPSFATRVRPGDVVVGGRSFGLGSSREQAAVALKLLGVGVVLARSFARIFYRNAINIGLPALTLPADVQIDDGEGLEVDVGAGEIWRPARGQRIQVQPLPSHLLAVIADGGLIAHLERRLATNRETTP